MYNYKEFYWVNFTKHHCLKVKLLQLNIYTDLPRVTLLLNVLETAQYLFLTLIVSKVSPIGKLYEKSTY